MTRTFARRPLPPRKKVLPDPKEGDERTVYSVRRLDGYELSYADHLSLNVAKSFLVLTEEEGIPVRFLLLKERFDEYGHWQEIERIELAVGT